LDTKFSRSLFGYDAEDVSERIKQMLSGFEKELRRREEAEKDAVDANDEMRLDLKRLQAEISQYRQREQAVNSALMKAQAESQTIEQEAEQRAGEMTKEAMNKIAAERAQLAELKVLLERFRSSFDQLLVSYKVEIAPRAQETTGDTAGAKIVSGPVH
jgi:cell division septum initiation protein DivIVA